MLACSSRRHRLLPRGWGAEGVSVVCVLWRVVPTARGLVLLCTSPAALTAPRVRRRVQRLMPLRHVAPPLGNRWRAVQHLMCRHVPLWKLWLSCHSLVAVAVLCAPLGLVGR
jgi:hypothetical protein